MLSADIFQEEIYKMSVRTVGSDMSTHSVGKLVGCAMGCWKLAPEKIKAKNLWIWGQKDLIVEEFVSQKIILMSVDEKKYPQKIVFNLEKVEKGGQNGGTYESPNIGGVPSLGACHPSGHS